MTTKIGTRVSVVPTFRAVGLLGRATTTFRAGGGGETTTKIGTRVSVFPTFRAVGLLGRATVAWLA